MTLQQLLGDRRVARGVGASVLLIFTAHFAYYAEQINDSAFVPYRCGWNLLAGRGPVVNVDEPGSPRGNPLMSLAAAGAIALFGPQCVLTCIKALSFVAACAALLASAALCAAWLRRIDSCRESHAVLRWLAPLLAAVNTPFVVNTTTGLETALFAGLLALGLWLDQASRDRARCRGAGFALGLAALARPEAAIVAAAVFAVRAGRRQWRSLGIDAASFALLAAIPWFIGSGTAACALPAGGPNAAEYILGFIITSLVVAVALLAIVPALTPAPCRLDALPATLACIASIAIVAATGDDWMPGSRLLVPYLPIWTALAVAGAASLVPRTAKAPSEAIVAVCLALAAIILYWQTDVRRELKRYVAVRADGYINGHLALARWIHSRARVGDAIAAVDTGVIGYECRSLPILDLARAPDADHLLRDRPAFVVIAFTAPYGEQSLDMRRVTPATAIEASVLVHPRFVAEYVRQRPPPDADDHLPKLAALFGADAFFEHDYPEDVHYFLAVYRKQPPAAAASAPASSTPAAEDIAP